MSHTSSPIALTDEQKAELELKIKDKGEIIRNMKEKGSSKDELGPHVSELLSLKALLNPSSAHKKGGGVEDVEQRQKQQQQSKKEVEDAESDYITPRSENYSKWYNDIIRVCSLAETSPVRGCMVIKPWGMSIWDRIRTDLDARIQEHGAENAYFPLLIPKSFLSKEAEHVDGFAKECAVVTHHRLTVSGDGKGLIADPEAELEDPLIIRPTSETMIWSMFKKWIVSHR
jgi:prolyl-tRNA synthetase